MVYFIVESVLERWQKLLVSKNIVEENV